MKPTVIDTQTYLDIVADSTDHLTLKVFDGYGRIAKIIQTQFDEGKKELIISLNDLKVGNYVINAFSKGTFLKAVRLIKNH